VHYLYSLDKNEIIPNEIIENIENQYITKKTQFSQNATFLQSRNMKFIPTTLLRESWKNYDPVKNKEIEYFF